MSRTRILAAAAAAFVALLAIAPPRPAHAATFVVNTTADAGGTCIPEETCSLRQAILAANSMPGDDTIEFDIEGEGPHTIMPVSPLPPITQALTIDGYTQPGSQQNTLADGNDAIVLIEIDGSSVASGGNGLTVTSGNVTIRGLAINNFSRDQQSFTGGNGIVFTGVSGGRVAGNFIGTDPTGLVSKPNELAGVRLEGAQTISIGGTAPEDRNVLSGNGDFGVHLASFLTQTFESQPSRQNLVQGNFVGTDATGLAALPNGEAGVRISTSQQNTIGGTEPGARNVISGNGDHGIRTQGAICTFNQQQQQVCEPGANLIQGNYIGTDVTGLAALPNESEGISMVSGSIGNVIGGGEPDGVNVIAGNGDDNVAIEDASSHDNVVSGNLIGLGVDGTTVVGGGAAGVFVRNSANNTIGGDGADEANFIAGNAENGVLISRAGSTGNEVTGNEIGLNRNGGPAPNGLAGVRFHNGAVGNTVRLNTIAYNGGPGVLHTLGDLGPAPNHNTVSENAVFGNEGLGIDINVTPPTPPAEDTPDVNSGDGVTENDTGDGDDGPNEVMNFPEILDAQLNGGSLSVTARVDATPGEVTVEFFVNGECDPSGNGEGRVFQGSTTATSGSQFTVDLGPLAGPGAYITATATNAAGSTSEFSECFALGQLMGDADCDGDVDEYDALAVLLFAAEAGPEPECAGAADVNCDGVADEMDALAILQYRAGVDYDAEPGCTPIGEVANT